MKTKLTIFLFFAALIVIGSWLARESVSIERIAKYEAHLRELIAQNPYQSLAAGIALYFVASLIPGTGGKSIVFGWLFGLWLGVAIVEIGLTAAAVISFFLSRYVLREVIESRWSHWLTRLDSAAARDGAFYLLTLRMFHTPFTLINYLAGASDLSIRTFVWTTSLGLLPGTIVFVFLGTRLPTLRQLSENGVHSLVEPWLVVALIATGTVPWALRRLVRFFLPVRGTRSGELKECS